MEKVLLSVEVITVPAGKVGVAAPIGPVTSILAALDCASQPAEVWAVMMRVSIPDGGSKVRVPRVPGAGVASAAPFRSSDPKVAIAIATGAATNWREYLLRTIELTFFQKELGYAHGPGGGGLDVVAGDVVVVAGGGNGVGVAAGGGGVAEGGGVGVRVGVAGTVVVGVGVGVGVGGGVGVGALVIDGDGAGDGGPDVVAGGGDVRRATCATAAGGAAAGGVPPDGTSRPPLPLIPGGTGPGADGVGTTPVRYACAHCSTTST